MTLERMERRSDEGLLLTADLSVSALKLTLYETRE